MRLRLALALMLAALPCLSVDPVQLPRDPEGKVVFQEAFMVDGASEPELYARAKAWLKAKSSPQAMMMTDMTDGQSSATISVRDAFPALTANKNTQVTVYYILTIETRDSRYRYTVDRLTVALPKDPRQLPLEQSFEGTTPKPGNERLPEDIQTKIQSIAADLKVGMNTPAPAAAPPATKPG